MTAPKRSPAPQIALASSVYRYRAPPSEVELVGDVESLGGHVTGLAGVSQPPVRVPFRGRIGGRNNIVDGR
jgi:hypothetical protein